MGWYDLFFLPIFSFFESAFRDQSPQWLFFFFFVPFFSFFFFSFLSLGLLDEG